MKRQAYSRRLPDVLLPFWEHRFAVNGRASQIEGALHDWTTWIVMGGRGSGKTRLGAEWVRSMVFGDPFYGLKPTGRIALVGETYGDAREVMVEGESGILAVSHGDERPVWTPSRRRLEWSNGAVAHVFSSEDPDALRGPQFSAAWCDAKTIWASLIAVFAALATGFGHPVDAKMQADLVDIAIRVIGLGASVLAIFGRLTAISRIV